MRSSRVLRALLILAMAFIIAPMMAMTAYAYSDENEDKDRDIDLSEILIPIINPMPVPEPEPPPEPMPLTPPGNLNLVDDISGEQAQDKQFITVVTRNGNFFYIVIDRAADNNNVHFLSLVDESELLAILEDEASQAPPPAPVQAAPTPPPETAPAPEPEPAPARSGNTGSIILLVVLLGALGGGAYYYFKILKPKQAKKGGATNLDEFEFDDEDDFDSGSAEYISAGGLEEPEYEDYEVLPTAEYDVPDDEYRDEYTYESYIPNTDRLESDSEE